MKEALFWNRLEGGNVACSLCPHKCIIKPGKAGFCRVRRNDGGVLVNDSYGAVTAMHSDPIEKKPLYHYKPGSQIFSIGTYGCNLACDFCQNHEISQGNPYFSSLSPEQIVEGSRGSDCIGIAFTYSEPITWIEFVLDVAHLNEGSNVMVTNGYINEEPLGELIDCIDAFNVDVKGGREFYRKLCHSPYHDIISNVRSIYEAGLHVEVTNLIIPGYNDSREEIGAICHELSQVSADIPLHFSRFFPQYKMLDTPPTPLDRLEMAYNIAKDEGIRYIYIGNVHGMSSSTFCPKCGMEVVERNGYYIKNNMIVDSKCPKCGEHIYGTW